MGEGGLLGWSPGGRGAGGWRVILGGILAHLCLGTLYTWGNLSVYVTSFLKIHHPHITYEDTIIIYGCQIGAQSCLMYLGGLIEQRLGPRLTVMIGGSLVAGATALASTTTSLWSMALVYGVLFGTGVGLTYTAPLVCGYKWFPDHKGLVSGFILSGFGAGAFVFNQVATALVNPDNEAASVKGEGELYYGPGPVVDAVPRLFLSLGAIYAVMLLAGASLLADPQYQKIGDEQLLVAEEGEEDGEEEEEGGAAANGAGRPSSSSSSSWPQQRQQHHHDLHPSCLSESDCRDLTPAQLVRTWQAWHVSLSLMLGALGGLITLATYKKAGILHFNDDRFMALTGSLASLGNAAGRLFWGAMCDALGPYVTLYGLTLLLSGLFLTWGMTVAPPIDNKWAFAFWTVGICFCHGGNFSCFPTVTAWLFGKTHVGPNFGLVFLPYGLLSLVGIALLPRLSAGLSPLNYILGGVALAAFFSAMLLAHCYHQPPRQLHHKKKASTARDQQLIN